EHALGVLAHLVEGAGELDAAGLAAATGMDLGLDHPEVAGNGLGRIDRFFGRAGDAPGGHRDAVIGEQLLGLVFVEVHVGSVLERIAARPGTRRPAGCTRPDILADAPPVGKAALRAGPRGRSTPILRGPVPRATPPWPHPPQPLPTATIRCAASCTCSRSTACSNRPCWR